MVASSKALTDHVPGPVPNAVAAFLQTPMRSLVADNDVSNRLDEAFRDAASLNAFPFESAGEYLAAGKGAVTAVAACTPGFGRRAARELDALVRDAGRRAEARAASERERSALLLCDTPIGRLFADEPLPARVIRLISHEEFASLAFRTYARDWPSVEPGMRRAGNCGLRSVRALRERAAAVADGQLCRAGLSEAERAAALDALFGHAPTQAPNPAPEDLGEECDPDGYLDRFLGTLPTRTEQVLKRRFGLSGRAPETLADIGQDLGVTRERVRQIESKGLAALRSLFRRSRPVDLRAAEEVGWSTLAGERRYLTDPDAQEALRKLDGRLRLTLEIADISASDWLQRVAKPLGTGWVDRGRDTGPILAAADALSRRSKPLPRALGELGGGLHPDDLKAAALMLGLHVEGGYLFAERPLARMRRATGLHALLARRGRPVGLAELHREYREAVANDACSYRDALIVMEAARHLFVEIADDVWAALGEGGSPPAGVAPAPNPAREPEDEATVIGALERELARTGPTRLGLLLERSLELLPPGRSVNSIGPTLLTNRTRFARPLPGVYALPDQVLTSEETLRADRVDYLLEPHQARLYALGRRSGEPWGAFPLWTPAAEYRLCGWAREKARPELFRTLLAVASPDAWPVDEAERSRWRDAVAVHARFDMAFAPRAAVPFLPPLDRVLAACIHVTRTGRIGWMACNRILGLRIDSQTSTALLAVLIAARVVVEPHGDAAWQLPHGPGPALKAWTDRLARELGETGVLDWTGPAGRALAAEIGRPAATGSAPEPEAPQSELDEFEQLLVEHRRSVRSKRRDEALQWLDVE